MSTRVLGLGFLPYSNMVHFEAGSERHKVYESELKAGLWQGYAAADGAALHFVDTGLAQVVASRPKRGRTGSNSAATTPRPPRSRPAISGPQITSHWSASRRYRGHRRHSPLRLVR